MRPQKGNAWQPAQPPVGKRRRSRSPRLRAKSGQRPPPHILTTAALGWTARSPEKCDADGPRRPLEPTPQKHPKEVASNAWKLNIGIKTLYVGNHTDTFNFLATLAMEKSAATVIYLHEDIELNGAQTSIHQLLLAISKASARDMQDKDVWDPFYRYSPEGDWSNQSIHEILHGIYFADHGARMLQVLPNCFVHTRQHLCGVHQYEKTPVLVAENEEAQAGIVNLWVLDKRYAGRTDVHQISIGCAHVKTSALADVWLSKCTRYWSVGDQSRTQLTDLVTDSVCDP